MHFNASHRIVFKRTPSNFCEMFYKRSGTFCFKDDWRWSLPHHTEKQIGRILDREMYVVNRDPLGKSEKKNCESKFVY